MATSPLILCIYDVHTCYAHMYCIHTHTRSKEFYVKENDTIGEDKVVLP